MKSQAICIVCGVLFLGACGTSVSSVHLEYRGFSPLQEAELNCALYLVEGLAYVSGSVWKQPVDDTGIWGQTRGMDTAVIIDLQDIPALPQVFVHELVHILAGQEIGSRNADHSNPRYFGPGSLAEKWSYQAYELCQRGSL